MANQKLRGQEEVDRPSVESPHLVRQMKGTLDSGINVGVRLLILGLFSSGYVFIKGGKFNNFFIFLIFLFPFFILWLCIRK